MGLIGLATKAGKTAGGEFLTEREVKSGRAPWWIVAEDASENTKKKFQNMCEYYKVPIRFYGDKDTLGHAMGKTVSRISCGTGRGIGERDQETYGYGRELKLHRGGR